MLDNTVFDPDIQDRVSDEMTPAEFGIHLARIFQETPSSGNWTLASRTIEAVTGWSPDWDQAERLINRIAECDLPSPSAGDLAAGNPPPIPVADSRRLTKTIVHALRALLDGPQRDTLPSDDSGDLLCAKEVETVVSACHPIDDVGLQCVVSDGQVQGFSSSHPLAYLLKGVTVLDFDAEAVLDTDEVAAPVDGSAPPRSCHSVLHLVEPSGLYRIEPGEERAVA